jgi:hypothetical protein
MREKFEDDDIEINKKRMWMRMSEVWWWWVRISG